MDKFDKEIFESVIDHIILGGTDEKGNKNPHLLTFVFKTGISQDIDGSKKAIKGKKNKDKKISSSQSSDACGGRNRNTKSRIYKIAVFTRVLKDFKFIKNGQDFRNKMPVGELEICFAVRT